MKQIPKQIPKQESEDTPISNPEQYDQNLEKIAISMLTKGSIKHKVRDFKTRVLGLLNIYLDKIKSVNIFISSIIPMLAEVRPTDVPKLDGLIQGALRKSATIEVSQLKTLVDHYLRLIIKTARWKDSKKITETFADLLRALMEHGVSVEEVKGMIVDLLQKYIYKRGVKIHPETLQYLLKKFKFVRDAFHDTLQKALANQSLRQAMKKQVRKMLRWFGKQSNDIKIE